MNHTPFGHILNREPGQTGWRRDPYFAHAEIRMRWWFDNGWRFTIDRRLRR